MTVTTRSICLEGSDCPGVKELTMSPRKEMLFRKGRLGCVGRRPELTTAKCCQPKEWASSKNGCANI